MEQAHIQKSVYCDFDHATLCRTYRRTDSGY